MFTNGMAVVSFRVPDDVRKHMNELDLDWPERLRAFVEEEIRRQKALEGLKKAEAFQRKYAKYAVRGYNASDEVRRSRDRDH
jgi:hypothetical protein